MARSIVHAARFLKQNQYPGDPEAEHSKDL
jgi:hypothetical protein